MPTKAKATKATKAPVADVQPTTEALPPVFVPGNATETVLLGDAVPVNVTIAEAPEAPTTEAPAANVQPEPEADPAGAIAEAKRLARIAIHARDAGRVSIPVKSALAFKRDYKRDPGSNPKRPTVRQAAMLAVACHAAGQPLADGATFSRRFKLDGRDVLAENGCTADLRGVLADYNPATETFTLRTGAVAAIRGLLGALAS